MAAWQERVRPVVEAVLPEYDVPGLVLAVARGDGPVEALAVGTDAAGTPLEPDSLLPIASITKAATALAVLRLVDAGRLGLDDPLSRHAPEAAAAREGVTLRRILCHTAGLLEDLPPGAAPYAPGLDWPALARATLATPPAEPPGVRVNYCNLGCGLLAVVVERATDRPFRIALHELVLDPLGIEGYLGVEPPRPCARTTGNLGEHAGTELEPFNSAFWRAVAFPWGGLVTTAANALAIVRAYAGRPPGFLSPGLRAEATRDQTGGLGGRMAIFARPRYPWGLGVELRGPSDHQWTPPAASPDSFGHAGSSGALAWHDPTSGVTWAMLGTLTFDRWWRSWPTIGAAVLEAAS